MALTYTNISSTTLGAYQSTVTLSSIPSTYTDLMLVCSLRGDRQVNGDPLEITINGLSSGWSYTRFMSNAGGRVSTNISTDSRINVDEVVPQAFFNSTGLFNNTQIYFPNYTSSASKVTSVTAGFVSVNNGTINGINMTAGLNSTTSAISSITLWNGFIAGSSFYLYGIKNS
jgi:hypothetical protein